jgi:hypothetical protein
MADCQGEAAGELFVSLGKHGTVFRSFDSNDSEIRPLPLPTNIRTSHPKLAEGTP